MRARSRRTRFIVRDAAVQLPHSPGAFLHHAGLSRACGEGFRLAPNRSSRRRAKAGRVDRGCRAPPSRCEFSTMRSIPFVSGTMPAIPEQFRWRRHFRVCSHSKQQYGRLIKVADRRRALKRKAQPETRRRRRASFSFRNGMANAADALAQKLARIEYGCEGERVFRVVTMASGVRSTGDGHCIRRAWRGLSYLPCLYARIGIGEMASTAARALQAILAMTPVAVTASVYRRGESHFVAGFGFLRADKGRTGASRLAFFRAAGSRVAAADGTDPVDRHSRRSAKSRMAKIADDDIRPP